jgi:hypothetical protein
VPIECLIGQRSIIPGVLTQTQQLPHSLALFTKELYAPTREIYMHDLDLSGLNQLEESFRAYLRKLCESE